MEIRLSDVEQREVGVRALEDDLAARSHALVEREVCMHVNLYTLFFP